jgi:predicted N-acetyltransferase YhbS
MAEPRRSSCRIVVRPAEPEDLAALSNLARETFCEAFGYSFNASDLALPLEETRSEAYFRETIRTDTVLVALDESTIVGYVQLSNVTIRVESATDSDQQLSALYVDSEHQGKGIGKLLVAVGCGFGSRAISRGEKYLSGRVGRERRSPGTVQALRIRGDRHMRPHRRLASGRPGSGDGTPRGVMNAPAHGASYQGSS